MTNHYEISPHHSPLVEEAAWHSYHTVSFALSVGIQVSLYNACCTMASNVMASLEGWNVMPSHLEL